MNTVDQKIQGASLQKQSPCSSWMGANVGSNISSLFGSAWCPSASAYKEHSHLFSFKPSSSKLIKKGRGQTPAGHQAKLHKVMTWTKEAICLRCTDQVKASDLEEKMKLAQMGLGWKRSSSILMEVLAIFTPRLVMLIQSSNIVVVIALCILGVVQTTWWQLNLFEMASMFVIFMTILKSTKLFIRPLRKDRRNEELW